MQLSADLAKPVPVRFRMLGVRLEFGSGSGKRSSDVIVLTGSQATSSERRAKLSVDSAPF